MRELHVRELGRTGLTVSTVCAGTSPLGNIPQLYGHAVDHEQAVRTVEAVFDSPISFLDTSNAYGDDGTSERRIGEAIRRRGGLPAGFVLQTKVDPDPVTRDFSGARVRRSLEESFERLGVDHLPLLALHDPENMADPDDGFSDGGALQELVRIRDEGLADTLVVAAGDLTLIRRYLETGEFGAVLNHNQYTLLDRSAESLFRWAHDQGIGVLNAAPYGGGMLAKGPTANSKYRYTAAAPELIEAARRMQAACERAGVPLASAALQFSTRASFVDSTVVGFSAPERVTQTLELLDIDIDEELWSELDAIYSALG